MTINIVYGKDHLEMKPNISEVRAVYDFKNLTPVVFESGEAKLPSSISSDGSTSIMRNTTNVCHNTTRDRNEKRKSVSQ